MVTTTMGNGVKRTVIEVGVPACGVALMAQPLDAVGIGGRDNGKHRPAAPVPELTLN